MSDSILVCSDLLGPSVGTQSKTTDSHSFCLTIDKKGSHWHLPGGVVSGLINRGERSWVVSGSRRVLSGKKKRWSESSITGNIKGPGMWDIHEKFSMNGSQGIREDCWQRGSYRDRLELEF